MLILSRNIGQRIIINGNIVIEVVVPRFGHAVALGITAPKNVTIHREEVQKFYDAAERHDPD